MELNRQNIEKTLLTSMAPILTEEKYKELESIIKKTSDEELTRYAIKCIKTRNEDPRDDREIEEECWKKIERIRKRDGITPNNSAYNLIQVQTTTSQKRHAMQKELQTTKPSDYIQMSSEEDESLAAIWDGGHFNQGVPSDIFFSGNVPLLDCHITVDETTTSGHICPFRVHIYSDYADIIKKAGGSPASVGLLSIESTISQLNIILEIKAIPGLDTLAGGDVVCNSLQDEHLTEVSQRQLGAMATAYLTTWYSIQIALLHPNVKDVFSSPIIRKVKEGKRRDKDHKRVTKYVRKHIIKAKNIDDAFKCKGNYERRSLVWYVIGHWRHYADGKKVFVHPYWKGALRKLKMDLDDRERIIDKPEGGERCQVN